MGETTDIFEENTEIEESSDDRIASLKKKMKICSNISVVAIIFIVICIIAEALVSSVVADKDVARKVLSVLTFICNVLPFVVMLPLFFRVNLRTKLSIELKKKEGN